MSGFDPIGGLRVPPPEAVRFAKNQISGVVFAPVRLTPGRAPGVVLAADLADVQGPDMLRFAERFAHAGFCALVFDYRGFGASDDLRGPAGSGLRQLADPWEQIEDIHVAIAFLRRRPEVDPDRVGLWGAGLAGGHVLQAAADDDLLAAVVSQGPIVSGRQTLLDTAADGDAAEVLAVADPAAPERPALFSGAEAQAHFARQAKLGVRWRNALLRGSLDLVRAYEPIAVVDQVTAPLMFVLAADDLVGHTDLQVLAYRRATAPKRLHVVDGGHHAFFGEALAESAAVAASWFARHLHDQRETAARAAYFDSLF